MPTRVEAQTGHIWPLGSVQRLAGELERLAGVLEIPADLTSEDRALHGLLNDRPVTDGRLWQAQPIAAHMLLVLREACAQALKTRAAICFC
jgi:hypothetical protein